MPLAMLILRRRAALASNCSTCVKDGVRKRRARISLGVKCADEADAAAASFILLSRAPAVSMRKHSRRLVDWHTGRTAAGQRNGTALAQPCNKLGGWSGRGSTLVVCVDRLNRDPVAFSKQIGTERSRGAGC
jgi:hypothetical protein